VSVPVAWEHLGAVRPGEVTVTNGVDRLAAGDSWAALLPEPQALPADLVAEGHGIPVARVQAMHEGKRRARARREEDG
jgi:bifunctional non-homologous end joining protein LigD